MATVTISDLHKSFGKTKAVNGISVDIANGEFFVILGPSGAGKTTTLKSVAGFHSADGSYVWGALKRKATICFWSSTLNDVWGRLLVVIRISRLFSKCHRRCSSINCSVKVSSPFFTPRTVLPALVFASMSCQGDEIAARS